VILNTTLNFGSNHLLQWDVVASPGCVEGWGGVAAAGGAGLARAATGRDGGGGWAHDADSAPGSPGCGTEGEDPCHWVIATLCLLFKIRLELNLFNSDQDNSVKGDNN